MELRTLGSTGLSISRIGLGLAALGRPGYINLGHATDLDNTEVAVMAARAHTVLDAAWAAGVRYFDAARSYGKAEEFLAAWLRARAIAPTAVTIGSKWGYTYTAGWQVQADRHEVKDHSLATLQRQAGESRAMLGPYLRLYQIHSATQDSGVLTDDAVLTELARLRDTGWQIGLSVTGPRQADTIRQALPLQRGGRPLFTCVQATWNLLEPSAGTALAEAHAAGLGVIVKEALANGRLTARNPAPAVAPLLQQARDLGTTPDALALAAALAQPWADVILSGAATVEQLHANLAALHLPQNATDRLASLAEPPETYWLTRSRLPWN